MRKILLFVISISILSLIQAQILDWGYSFNSIGNYHWGNTVLVDDDGNSFIAGGFISNPFGSIDFDPSANKFNIKPLSTSPEGFLASYDKSGNFRWAIHLVQEYLTMRDRIVIDRNSNVIATGKIHPEPPYVGFDFDPSNNTATVSGDAYLVKYSKQGSLVWLITLPSCETPQVTIGSNDDIYVDANYTGTANFGNGVTLTSSRQSRFVAKFDRNGNALWAISLEGPARKLGPPGLFSQMVFDNAKNFYFTAAYYDTLDIDPGVGQIFLTSPRHPSGFPTGSSFLAKFDSTGKHLWSYNTPGEISNIAVNSQSELTYVATFRDTIDADPGPGIVNYVAPVKDFYDIVLVRLDSMGQYIGSGHLGAPSMTSASCVYNDVNDNILLAGYFVDSMDFDLTSGTHFMATIPPHRFNSFIASYNKNLNLNWVINIGKDSVQDIALHDTMSIMAVGMHWDTADLDPSSGIANIYSSALEDIFLARYAMDPSFLTSAHFDTEEKALSSRIYPNPATDKIYLDLGHEVADEMKIVTLSGQVLRRIYRPSSGIVDVNDLFPGLYFVQVTVSGSTSVHKLIISE